MNTQEILSIIALSLLGLCFLCGLAKTAMKKDSDKKNCDKACSLAIFAAVALVGVSQLLTETEKYACSRGGPPCEVGSGYVPFCNGQFALPNQGTNCTELNCDGDPCMCCNPQV